MDGRSKPLTALLRDQRKLMGMTLEAVADEVGLTAGALSHIESGRRLPDPKNALRIAAALGLSDEEVLDALDRAHAERRRTSAYQQQGQHDAIARPRQTVKADQRESDYPSQTFYAQPIEALFHEPLRSQPQRSAPSSARNLARWSDDTSARIEAIDALADTAAEAIRTLRGLLDDENETVRREARRLLRELDVRLPEE